MKNLITLLIDGNRGIHQGEVLGEIFANDLTDAQKSDLSTVDNENYLETWEEVMGMRFVVDGTPCFLESVDGNIFAVAIGYSLNEDGEIIEDATGNKIEL